MSDYQPIIDVTPVGHSSERNAGGTRGSSTRRSSRPSRWSAPSSRHSSTGADSAPPFGSPRAQGVGEATASKGAGSVVAGLAQMAAGAGLVLIGIPMLILPGPGLLSIAGGIMLAANGARKVFACRT